MNLRGLLTTLYTSEVLDEVCLFEGRVRSIFCDGAECFGRYVYRNVRTHLRYVDALLLKIWRATNFADRVKLRRTSAVAVASSNLGLLARDVAFLCHKCCGILPQSTAMASDERTFSDVCLW